MEIIVRGKRLQLNITPLGDPMDPCLKRLFTRFFANPTMPYPVFIRDNYADLQQNIHSYLDAKMGNPPGQDFLFNNLTIIWNHYQDYLRFIEAQLYWQDILNIVLEWENTRKARVHKGSLFYFWSQTAIIQGQLDKGFFLIHSAYEEDVLTHQNALPGTPAFKTVSFDYIDQNNFLFPVVEEWAKYLDGYISRYPNLPGGKLTLDTFRVKFLASPPSRDTLFLFTHTLARFHDFDRLPTILLKGSFACIFESNALFDLLLVTDNVIYSGINNPTKHDYKFKNLANHLLVKSGISTDPVQNDTHLNHTNSIKDVDFEATINGLLDQTFAYPDGITPSRLECDVSIAYCLRNHSAHNIGSLPVIQNRYEEIRQSIFNVLFLAVETL